MDDEPGCLLPAGVAGAPAREERVREARRPADTADPPTPFTTPPPLAPTPARQPRENIHTICRARPPSTIAGV